MSDIWIKTTNTGTTRWRKALSIKIKRFSSTWVAAKVIWIKNASSGWLRVWPTSGVFAITSPFIASTASGSTPFYGNLTVGTNDVIRIGTTYYGRNGTWDPNGFTISSYSYSWPYYSDSVNQPGDYDLLGNLGTGVYSSPSQSLNISTSTDATNTDGKYISFKITANASNSLYSNSADSKDEYGKIRVIRRTPINISFAITGSTTVGSVLSVGSSWNITEARKPDAGRTTIKWYRSDSATAIYSGGGRTEIPSTSGSYQYTLVQADLGKYIVAEETTFNTGSDYDIGVDLFTNGQNQVTAVSAIITSVYSFAFGNTLYVGSNGYIGLDNGGSTAASPGSGRNINVYSNDLVQYKLQEYSDSSNYYLYFRAYRYQSPLVRSAANAVDYQIKFYTDQAYCDIYIVRKGSSVPIQTQGPGYYNSGFTGYAGIPGPYAWAAGSVLRAYFNGNTGSQSAFTWTAISDNVWKDITNADIDDSFTSVVTSANQSAPIPVNTALPTLTTDTGNFSAGSTITINPGTWTNTNSYAYELLYGTGTPISDTSTSTKTLVSTNTYVITNADATSSSYYFRGRVTAYAGSGQTGVSTIALSTTSSRSYINSSTTISVGTATSSGFTISGTASPPVYTSISSIQIFNSSQTLISTITTGLPTVNSTTGDWSYIWTGGSSSTTYYAKVTVVASDSAVTTFTTAFSSSIETSAGVSTPTALSATNNSGAIRLTFSGGSGDQYDVFYQNSATRPTDGQAFADYPNVTSPYDPPLTSRNATRYFWVRKSTGSIRSNWYPSDSSVSIRLPLFAPPTPNTPTSSGVTTTNITVSWTAGTVGTGQDAGSSFEVYTSATNSTPATTTSGTAKTSPASYTYTASASPSTQYFWVRAVNADANSAWSSVLSATPTALNPPGVVSSVASTAKTSTSITWGWSAPTTGGTPTGYEYAISTDTTEPSSFTNLGSTTRSVTTSSLTANTDYYLFVKAKNADGTSSAVRNATAVKTDTATTYTLSYSANGGASTPAVPTSQTTSGTTTVATRPAFTRTNCTLGAGWNTAADGSGTNYSNGSSITISANTILYAKWTAVTPTAAAPSGFTFVGNINSNTQKRWSWNAQTTVTNGTVATNGYRWQLSETNPNASGWNGAFTEGTQGATSRTISVANASSNPRWMRVCVNIVDGLGNLRNGSFTSWL